MMSRDSMALPSPVQVDAPLDPVSHVPSPKSQKGLDKWSVSPAEVSKPHPQSLQAIASQR